MYWVACPLNMVNVGVPAAMPSDETSVSLLPFSAVWPVSLRYVSFCTSTYSWSTGSISCGSITTAPYMPEAMCRLMGVVEQWYSQMPVPVASKRYTSFSPGAMVFIVLSGETMPAWKSSECPIDPLFSRVISKTSPSLPCRIGPIYEPLNVHAFTSTPGATSRLSSCTSMVILCTVFPSRFSPAGTGCSTGSRRS